MQVKIVKKKKPSRREILYKEFILQLTSDEKAFIKKIKPLFDIQEEEVLRNAREAMKSLPAFAINAKAIDDFLFNEEQQIQVFIKFERPVIIESLNKAGQRVNDELGLGKFEPFNARVDRFLDEKVPKFATDVNETTSKKLRETIQEGISGGEGIDEVQKRITGVFDSAKGARARAMARTEIGSALNYGHWEAYQQSEVIKQMEWVHITPGESARPEHIDMDGVVVDKGDTFFVAGENMRFPRDPSASPSNTVNCACTTIAVIK